MVELSGIPALLESNRNLLFDSNQTLSLNADLLQSLGKLVNQASDSEKPLLRSLIEQLNRTQAGLHSEYQLKVIEQKDIRQELINKNKELEIVYKKLEDKEKDYENINTLEADSSIIRENQLKIMEVQASIEEKKRSIEHIEGLNQDHLKNIENNERKKAEIVEKECEMRSKLRKLEKEHEKKKVELERSKEMLRDMETGRLEQSMSPRSSSILKKMAENRNSPVKNSSVLNESNVLPLNISNDKVGVDKGESDLQAAKKATSRYTLLLLSLISLLLAIIFKLVFF